MTTTASAASKIAERYATALIETGTESGAIDAIERDFTEFSAMMGSSAELTSLISNPVYSAEQQGSALLALAQKAGFNKVTANFFGVLAQNRRLDIVQSIIVEFRHQLARRRGEVKAKVVTAIAMTADQQQALQDTLKKTLGFQVTLDASVDPSLLGGMVLTVGSRMIDDSVRRKLERLKLNMQTSNQNVKLQEVG